MITLTDIQNSKSVIDDLALSFDFNVGRAFNDNSWIKLIPEKKFMVIAGDSTGGVFLTYGDAEIEQLPILHATSEGQAGRVASNLGEFLAIMMVLPYWRDLLKFSGAGNLIDMQQAAVFIKREYAEEYPDYPNAMKRIMDILPIPIVTDPIKLIHDSIHATDCTLVANDGWIYESLFNIFKSSDNRNWK